MKKIKVFFDPRKEEAWLNSMEGYRLTNVGFITYNFEETKKKYQYSLNYTPGKIAYLELLNNMKSGATELKHSLGWTYLEKEAKLKTFYRDEQVHKQNLKLFVHKYNLYRRAFCLFGIASFAFSYTIDILFIICGILFWLLSFLYTLCIRTTAKQLKNNI